MLDHNRQHVENRLDVRGLAYTVSQLDAVAQKYTEDTAVILGKQPSREGREYGYELVILIVRGKRPVTIMYRRQSQNIDKRNFNVNKVVYL